MNCFLDFETRSPVDLNKSGAWKYSENAEILCCAIAINNQTPAIYFREDNIGKQLLYLSSMPETIFVAHNSFFEKCMWKNRFPNIPIPDESRWRCTAAQAAAFGLPRSLDNVAIALCLNHTKDKDGYRLMLKMCKPLMGPDWPQLDYDKLGQYCIQDVIVEREVYNTIPQLLKSEQRVFELDQTINFRGVYIDIPLATRWVEKTSEAENESLIKIADLAQGSFTSTRQNAKARQWMTNRGVNLDNLKKETVKNALAGDLPQSVREVLTIQRELSKSSVSKFKAMLNVCSKDNRARGIFLFNGARTARWTAKMIQFHNFPRNTMEPDNIEWAAFQSNKTTQMFFDNVFTTASQSLRGMVCAAPGKELIVADFKSIEARVLAWVSGEERVLQAFRDKLDLYVIEACGLYDLKFEDVTKDQRLQGKVAVLSLGYQGWVGAFMGMGALYGLYLEEDKAIEIIKKWRAKNTKIVEFWAHVEKQTVEAIKNPDTKFDIAKDIYCFSTKINGVLALRIVLPSKRAINYYNAETRIDVRKGKRCSCGFWSYSFDGWECPKCNSPLGPFEKRKQQITFWGVASDDDKIIEGKKEWGKIPTYGGKLTENIASGIARDLLVHGMFNVEAAGYPVVMHVHDELIAEVDKGSGDVEEYCSLMATNPLWADGLPLEADGFRTKRYHK